jgi:hypothetical protein
VCYVTKNRNGVFRVIVCYCVAVDFIKDPLPPADAYVLGHVIHCYKEAEVRYLLRKINKALPAGRL